MNFIEPKQINIENITDKMLNQKLKVQGTIFKIQDKETFKIISILDSEGNIDVLCNCKNKNNFKIQDEILVTGIVQEYNQNFQIQADKIMKIEN
tara:strand:- start:552 stop:833 length:282 start_codon:yes stop_codon:yes gene_type:complete